MKPLKLKLKNIGPFLDETVDFSQLSDMFLVRGKTGSGKTTIFDAMTYALYGEVTGIRQTKSVKLHSDYVPAEESGLVVFEFLLNHQVYRISRTAKADTLSKTGKLRRAVNQMTLEKKDDDNWTVLDGTPTELTQKVRDLIGLSREEFSQIVLLPQGEFAAFLRQDPSERKQTLSKLFPVEFYSSLCDFVKQKASVAEQQMSALSVSLESETENFDRERAVSESLSIKNEIDSLKTANDELALSIQMVSAEKEKLNLELNSALEAEKLTAQIKNLELQKEKIKSDRNKIYLSETAAAVKNAVLQRDRAEVKLLDTQNNIASSKKVLSDLQKKYDELDGQKKEFSDVSLKIEKLSLSVNDEIKKLEQSEKIEQAKKKLTEAKSKLCEYFSKIVPALSLCEKQLGENKLTVTGISDSLETAENAKKVVLTREGLRNLEKEIEDLKVNKRKEVAAKIKEAREQGDLSENAEYDAAKEEQAKIEARIEEIEKMLKNVDVFDDDDVDESKVSIGCKVVIRDIEYDDDFEFKIVGSTEANSLEGKISNESPVGIALIGKSEGDVIEVEVPAGVVKYEILKIVK